MMSLFALLENSVHKYRDRIAFEDDRREVTYGEFIRRVDRLGQVLLGLGVRPGETIAAIMHNAIELAEFDAAAARFGFVRTMINVRAPMDDHVYCINSSKARVVIFEQRLIEHVEKMRDNLECDSFVCVGGKVSWAPNYEELLSRSQERKPEFTPKSTDLHSIYFTSGTTGRPKGVMLTHGNWLNVVATHLMDLNPNLHPDDIGLLCAPMTHATGSLVLPHLARGARLKIIDNFDPERVADLSTTRNITASFMAPTMVQMLMKHMPSGSREKLNFRSLLYGGAAFPIDRLVEAREIFGSAMRQVYGQWEAPVVFCVLHPHEHFLRSGSDTGPLYSAGRATTLAEIAIMDDDGNLVPPGETGEIVTAGDHLMHGYLNNEIATRELRNGKWQRTGDVGEMDEGGFVYITDRKRDMIVTGGNNVYPRQIEEVVYQHPQIEEACVVGIPDELWGETVHLVAVLRPGADVSEEMLIEWTREKLPTDRRIRSIEIIETLPKNHYGKILRREVREAARNRVKV